MSGSELLSKQRRYNIGEYKNLNRLTANTVTLDYLKFGMDTSNVTITYPEDLTNDGYTLVLPNRSGISGEFLGIDDNNKLKWGKPNVINNVQFRYGIGLNTAVIDSTYTKGQIIYPENYEITITPTSTTSKLLIQFRCTYIASSSADTAITFYIYKTINNVETEVQVEANLGPLNGMGTNRSQYITSTVIESGTTDPIKISIAFAFNNIVDIAAQVGKIGILGENDYSGLNPQGGYSGYKNSIMVTDFEGSGAYSTLLSKSHDNQSIYYNLGTLFLGSNYNSLNTNNTSLLSLITEDGISAPLFIGHLQGNVTGNLTSNVIDTNILNGNIITTDELYSNIFTTNTLTLNIITSNMITTYDISINNSLKTKDLDVFGNLHVHGTQTIVNSEILNVVDNIIIVNADGNIEKQAGIQANIDGNLYDFFFDICLNGWSIYNKNLHLNKLLGNNISLTENITAQWLNGNINSNFVNVLGNININDNYILDVSAIKFSDGSFFNTNILNENIESINTNISTLETEMNAVEGNITILQGNVSTLQNNINQSVKNTSDVTFNSLTLQKDLLVEGNLTVKGNKTEFVLVNQVIHDNIITLNADGKVIKFFGMEGNVRGNIYSWLYDICNNSWTTKNNNLTTNKLIANVAEINNNLKVFGDIELHNNYILDVSAIRFKNGNYINGNSIPYIHGHLDNIYTNLTLIGNSLSSGGNSISDLQSNVAIIQANIITLEGNIINLQNQIEQGITSNSNVIFNDISANGNLIVGKTTELNKVVIHGTIDYFSDHINLNENFTLDPGPWGQIGGNINIQGNNLNVYKYLNVSNDALFKKDLTVNGNILASKFIGELSGNSLTSNKWKESKILNVNGNVSGNVLINANETMDLSLELENFGKSGIYGNNNSFPIITIDNYGRITDISLVNITFTGGSSANTDIGDILNVQYISTDILATSGYIRTNKIIGSSIVIDSNDLSVEGILTATHINADSITIANGSITVNKIISSNAIFTNDITVSGNLSVLGTQTILNSTIVEIDDNIIIVNADGELLKEAGLSANIGGNLYNFVFDICSNSWTTKNNDLRTNKLIANIIEISGNVIASWFNGNLSGSNATLTENVRASWFNGNLSGSNATLTENVRAPIFNGNLSGTNATLTENVTAPIFKGNLSGIYATLTDNVIAPIFNGNLSGIKATLTENVTAVWFNGNLSGTNATLTENVTALWFNGNIYKNNLFIDTKYININNILRGNSNDLHGKNFHGDSFNGRLETHKLNVFDVLIAELHSSHVSIIANNFNYDNPNPNINFNNILHATREEIILRSNILTVNNATTLKSNLYVEDNTIINKDLTVRGNLKVKGNKTEFLSVEHYTYDNIITLNADGNVITEFGIEGNVSGILHSFLYDTNNNYWHTNGKSVKANIIGDISGSNATFNKLNMFGNIVLDNNYILDVSAIKFSDGTFFNNNIFNANISSINSNISSVWGNITTMKIDISNNAGNITTLQNNIDQSVKNTSDVTFNSLTLQKDLLVKGNLTVKGNKTIVDSIEHIITDALITLNSKGSSGPIGIEGNTNNGIIQFVFDQTNNYWDTGGKAIKANIIGDISGTTGNLNMIGNINLNNNYWINDVSGILFADGTTLTSNQISSIGEAGGNIDLNNYADVSFGNMDISGNINFINGNTGIYYNNYNYIEKRNSKLELVLNNVWPYPSIVEPNQIKEYLKIYGSNLFLDSSSGLIIIGNDSSKNSDNCIQMNSRTKFNGLVDFKSPVYFNTNAELYGTMNINQQGISVNAGTGSYFKKCKVYIGPDFINGTNSITFDPHFTSKLGIYTLNPQAALDVSAASIFRDTITAEDISLNGNLYARRINFPSGNYIDDTEGIKLLYVGETSTFNGDSSFNSNVTILGNLTLGGSFNYSSDKRLKENNIDIINGIELIKKLKPQIYNKRNKLELDDNNYYIKESGFIAQDIEEVEELKHLINKPKNIEKEPYTMNYIGLIAYNTAATKELDNIVEQQKIKINSQENRIRELENKVLLQETLINQLISRIEALENS